MAICKGCGDKEVPHRVNTDYIRLRHLKNVNYVNLDVRRISNFEVLHFKLYYLCPVCGFYTQFEKDEASYAAIHFMANYSCYNCFHRCSIDDGFMIIVSPDRGIDIDNVTTILTEEEHFNRIMALKMFQHVENNFPIIGNA
jgi:hypothetical protein